MWRLSWHGRTVRWDDLTVSQASRLSEQVGEPPEALQPWAHPGHARAIVALLGFDPDQVRLGDFGVAKNDLPLMWEDGRPDGGRLEDGVIVALVRAGFTPRQVREEFNLRDLQLLVESTPEVPQ